MVEPKTEPDPIVLTRREMLRFALSREATTSPISSRLARRATRWMPSP
jgi:hypothetical protein